MDIPEGLAAESKPNGEILLSWNAVEDAAGYSLLREDTLTGESTILEIDSDLSNQQSTIKNQKYTDSPSEDNLYRYRVASVRHHNGQISHSGWSLGVEANSDSVPPETPQNLSLEKVDRYIEISFDPALLNQSTNQSQDQQILYNIYRSSNNYFTKDQLTPYMPGVVKSPVYDTALSSTEHYYAVSAVDKAGNESEITDWEYINPGLLPVSSVNIIKRDTGYPVLTWTHPEPEYIDGYNLYISDSPDSIPEFPVNSLLLTEKTYTDYAYTNSQLATQRSQTYFIESVEDYNTGTPVSITLPDIELKLNTESISRGIFNTLNYTIKNNSDVNIENAKLSVTVDKNGINKTSYSELFTLPSYGTGSVPVSVAGYDNLPSDVSLETTLLYNPVLSVANQQSAINNQQSSDYVRIISEDTLQVSDATPLLLTLEADPFARGTAGKAYFTLENTSDETIEIVTGKNGKASDEVAFRLYDGLDNLLSSANLEHILGNTVSAVSDGSTVARIAPGESYSSPAVNIDVPMTDYDNLYLELLINSIYHNKGYDTEVQMDGISAGTDVSIIDTAYYGVIDSVITSNHPITQSPNQQIITISGHAESNTDNSQPATGYYHENVPLNILVIVNGFKRTYEVMTDENGEFTFNFEPLENEYGRYTVKAVHPDLTVIPHDGKTFVISKTFINPVVYNLKLTRGQTKALPLTVKNGDGTVTDNVHLSFDPADNPGITADISDNRINILAADNSSLITLTLPTSVDIDSGQSKNLNFTVSSNENAPDSANIILRLVYGDDNELIDKISLNLSFFGSPEDYLYPILNFNKSYLETGLKVGNTLSETVTLKNTGTADAENVTLSLVGADQTNIPCSWIHLNTNSNLGTLKVGESVPVTLTFMPPAGTEVDKYYEFKIQAEENAPSGATGETNVSPRSQGSCLGYVYVTDSVENLSESAVFKVTDIYTGTLRSDSNLINGVNGAKIRIEEENGGIIKTGTTDANGELTFDELRPGQYKYSISAPEHDPKTGSFWVKPGVTDTVGVFLNYQLVSVEWEVKEIAVQDEYSTELKYKYEVNVKNSYVDNAPAAVVVAEPAAINVPQMKPGDVYQGEITFTNYGLMRAKNMYINATSNEYYKIEILNAVPEYLEAKQRITVPYRITCLKSDETEDSSVFLVPFFKKNFPKGPGIICLISLLFILLTLLRTFISHRDTETQSFYCFFVSKKQSLNLSSASLRLCGSLILPFYLSTFLLFLPINFAYAGSSSPGIGYGYEHGDEECKQVVRRTIEVFFYQPPAVKGSSGTSSGGGFYYISVTNNTAGGVSGYSKPIPPKKEIKGGPICFPKTECQDDCDDGCKDECCDKSSPDRADNSVSTGSSVKKNSGTYSDSVTALRVKVPGSSFGINRSYSMKKWHFSPSDDDDLKIEYDSNGFISSIKRGTAVYRMPENSAAQPKLEHTYDNNGNITDQNWVQDTTVPHVYYSNTKKSWIQASLAFDAQTQKTVVSGLRYDRNNGTFRTYNAKGQLLTRGDSNGVIEEYTRDADGVMTGVKDSTGRQIYWISEADNIKTYKDLSGRILRYIFNDAGLLSEVVESFAPSGAMGETDVSPQDANVTFAYEYDDQNRLIKKIHGERETTITYDINNRVASVTNAALAATSGHSSEGTTTEQEQRFAFAYDYDALTGLYYCQTTYPSGMVNETWTDEKGYVHEVKINGLTVKRFVRTDRKLVEYNESNGVTVYEYDEFGSNIKTTYPDGSVETKTYGKYNNITSHTNTLGVRSTFSYNENGDLISKVEAAGTPEERVTNYTYDANGLVTLVKLVDKETSFSYDSMGNMISTTDPEGNKTDFVCDLVGNKISETHVTAKPGGEDGNALGETTSYAYDMFDNVTKITYPGDVTEEFEYDLNHQITKSTDKNGGVTTFSYDAFGNLIKFVDPAGGETTMAYNTSNQPISITDQMGNVTEYEYDIFGNKIAEIDPSGNKISYEYGDGNAFYNQISKVIYPTYTQTITYNNMQRAVKIAEISGDKTVSESYEYNMGGHIISRIDKMGKTTNYYYDSLNRLVKFSQVIDDKEVCTLKEYNAFNNVVLVTDANGGKTCFEYDKNENTIKEINPLQTETLYSYDKINRLISKTDAMGQKIEYTYNDYGYLGEIKNYNSSEEAVKTMNFEYDKAGNMLSWNDGSFSGNFVYDVLNRKTSETVNYGEFSKEYKYSYYANSQKKSITYPDTSKDEYFYDKGRLSRIDVPGGTIGFNKYNWNSIENIQLPGGSSRSFSYDGFTNLKSLSAKDTGSNIVLDNSYTRDNQGFITDKQTISDNKTFGYNPLNNLTTIDEEHYTYDDLGNRLTDPEGNTYAYNKMNQLLSVSSESSVVDYYYDLNGNLTSKTTLNPTDQSVQSEITYSYNIDNRLTSINNLQLIINNYYDPFGRRLSKTVDNVTTYYFYSDEGLIGEYDSEGTEIVSYAYQPDSLWGTNPLYLKKDYKLYFYINNELGAPVQLMGVNGALVWQGVYDSFGNCTIDERFEIVNNLRLPGQYFDSETSLYYNWNRYYDPIISRYITKDPIGLNGGLNMYVYVESNPINYIDMFGLFHWHENWGGGGWAGGRRVKDGWNNPNSPNYVPGLTNVPPKDELDKCYKKHDLCYEDCRMNFTGLARCDCFSNCDRIAIIEQLKIIATTNKWSNFTKGILGAAGLGAQAIERDFTTSISKQGKHPMVPHGYLTR